MHTAGAPWLSLDRRLMCSPGTTEIKIRTNICTSMLNMHKTYVYINRINRFIRFFFF